MMKPRFDPTINLGHIFLAVTLLTGGLSAWTAMAGRLSILEERTVDYSQIRLLVNAHSEQINSLEKLVAANKVANEKTYDVLVDVSKSLASINAKMEARLTIPRTSTDGR